MGDDQELAEALAMEGSGWDGDLEEMRSGRRRDQVGGAVIRLGTLADASAVVALWDVAAGPTRLASDASAVEALLARDPEALLVAVDEDGAIVGTLVVGWDGWRCHLYRMAVAASHRRRGVGAALVDAALERARALGVRRLDAMVADDNGLGGAFWAARGFERYDHDSRWSRLTFDA